MQFPDGPPAAGHGGRCHIEGYDTANGLLILSRRGAAMQADWSSVAAGMIVEARVTETNKGGLSVDVNGIRGFMPISQIDLYRVEHPEQFVNQRLLCLVTEVNPDERNLVVSRRALLEREREENREKLWQEAGRGPGPRGHRPLGPGLRRLRGPRRRGRPAARQRDELAARAGSTHGGAAGPADQGGRAQDGPREAQGQPGPEAARASPWDNIAEKYPDGEVVTGKVTRLMDFGAFVELEPGVEGLIHISELAPQRVRRVVDVVQPDQEVQVKVLRVDKTQQRISLSLKAAKAAAEAPPEEEEEEEEPTKVKPPRPRTTPLRGGIGDATSGGLGLPGGE